MTPKMVTLPTRSVRDRSVIEVTRSSNMTSHPPHQSTQQEINQHFADGSDHPTQSLQQPAGMSSSRVFPSPPLSHAPGRHSHTQRMYRANRAHPARDGEGEARKTDPPQPHIEVRQQATGGHARRKTSCIPQAQGRMHAAQKCDPQAKVNADISGRSIRRRCSFCFRLWPPWWCRQLCRRVRCRCAAGA